VLPHPGSRQFIQRRPGLAANRLDRRSRSQQVGRVLLRVYLGNSGGLPQ